MSRLFYIVLSLMISNVALAEGVNIGNGFTNNEGVLRPGVEIGNGFAQTEQIPANSPACEGTTDVQLQKALALTKKTISKVSRVEYNRISISSQLNGYTPSASQKLKLYSTLVAELQSMFGPNAYVESLDGSSVYVGDLADQVFLSFAYNCSQD